MESVSQVRDTRVLIEVATERIALVTMGVAGGSIPVYSELREAVAALMEAANQIECEAYGLVVVVREHMP